MAYGIRINIPLHLKPQCHEEMSVSTDNRPQSGKKKQAGYTTRLLVAIIVSLAIVASVQWMLYRHPHKPAGNPQEKAEVGKNHNEKFARILTGAQTIKKTLRKPEGFKLEGVMLMRNSTICYSFGTHQGFGRLKQGAAILVGKENIMTNETEEFEDLWHDECEGGNRENLTAFTDMMMKKMAL
jgi:hypothetical protein